VELLMFHFEAGMSRKQASAVFNVNHTMRLLFKSKMKLYKRIARENGGH